MKFIFYTHENFPIPSGLVFEKLLGLDEKLTGQSVKIKSIFNPADNDPSMIIFLAEDNIYRFKDFSTGTYGDSADVASHMFGLERQDAYYKILDLFENDESVEFDSNLEFQKITKEVTSHKTRGWIKLDETYWGDYHIGGRFLNTYKIKPISEYTLTITKNGVSNSMVFPTAMSYGYFNLKGELCKIYNPRNKKAKFLKVNEMLLQGDEQLKYKAKCLILASSLKDIGAFKAMSLKDFELVAPDSENEMISLEKMDHYKSKYQYVFTMFDNDIAGMKAMKDYKQQFDIPYIYFNVEKDMADCIKEHGIENTKLFFKKTFKDALKKENNRLNKE